MNFYTLLYIACFIIIMLLFARYIYNENKYGPERDQRAYEERMKLVKQMEAEDNDNTNRT